MSKKAFDGVEINPHIAKKLGIEEAYYLTILTRYYVLENEKTVHPMFIDLIEEHFFISEEKQHIIIHNLIVHKALYFIGENKIPSINYDLQCDLLGLEYDK